MPGTTAAQSEFFYCYLLPPGRFLEARYGRFTPASPCRQRRVVGGRRVKSQAPHHSLRFRSPHLSFPTSHTVWGELEAVPGPVCRPPVAPEPLIQTIPEGQHPHLHTYIYAGTFNILIREAYINWSMVSCQGSTRLELP